MSLNNTANLKNKYLAPKFQEANRKLEITTIRDIPIKTVYGRKMSKEDLNKLTALEQQDYIQD